VRQAQEPGRWPGGGIARLLVTGLTVAALVLAAAAFGPAGTVPAHAGAGGPGGAGRTPGASAPPAARTVVSLTFDDGDADQLAAAQILHRYRLAGTFYIITGAIGSPGYLTRANLRQLAAAGNEIGGHTVSHLRLPALSTAEARRQVCTSRSILARWGYRVTSFAYPGGAFNPRVKAIVRSCGYRSARTTVGLRSPGCPGCARAESIPPAHPMAVRTPGEVDTSWTLSDLKSLVTATERGGGGWLPLVFHHVCGKSDCGELAIPATELDAFARWLAQRQRLGTVVRTVGQVIGGPARPIIRVAPAAPHGIIDPSLEHTETGRLVPASLDAAGPGWTLPRCWMSGGYGDNHAAWRHVTGAHAGRWAERVTITGYHSGDAKLLPRFDLGQCSLPVRPGQAYTLGTWYQSSASTQYAVYYRTWSGRWVYWRSSPFFPASPGWAHASWTTPRLPAGATGLSFGLALSANGSLTTDSYSFAAARPGLAAVIAVRLVLAGLAAAGLVAAARAARRRFRARRGGPAGPAPLPGPPGPAAQPTPADGAGVTSSSSR